MKRLPSLALVSIAVASCSTTTSNMGPVAAPAEIPGYPQGYDTVFSAVVNAVWLLDWKITVRQNSAGEVSAATPRSMATWGDKITIRVFKPDSLRRDSLVRVGFTSIAGQPFDWGKNARNQSAFYEMLNASLNTTGAPNAAEAQWPTVPPGSRVRIEFTARRRAKTGMMIDQGAGALHLTSGVMPLVAVKRIQVSRGKSAGTGAGRGARRGLVVGTIVGAGMALMGPSSASIVGSTIAGRPDAGGDEPVEAATFVYSTAFGAFVGAVVGATVGAIKRAESWQTLYPAPSSQR